MIFHRLFVFNELEFGTAIALALGMTIEFKNAIELLKAKGIDVTRPLAGVWFCNGQQVTESEMIRWAVILRAIR